MCGILGQINYKGNLANHKTFRKALNLQKHRGPDDEGILKINDHIQFGHQRLSIIDLSPNAKQPMTSSCQNYVIVFNGEIYNFNEIKQELINKGHRFFTTSDTEVLINAFKEYGIKSIDKFIGMFSFAIYDKKNDETYIVRDRLGIKPLYYYNDGEQFIFSSEIKSILKLIDHTPSLNTTAISSYFSFRYPVLNDTFFNDIYALEPGHYFKIKNRKITKHKYWDLAPHVLKQKDDKGEEYYINELRRILESAVKYRMISDVKFGAFLSGGVDSSVITALMALNSDEPIKTFTIGFKEQGYNEFDYAKIIADKYKTEHHEILLSGENYMETMDFLIKIKDAPLSVPNEVPLYLMSKELKKYITVVLSGEGADEIFGGYGRIFRSPYDYERIKNIDQLDLTESEKEELALNFVYKYHKKHFSNELEHFLNLYSYTSFDEKKSLLNKGLNLNQIEEKLKEKFLSVFNEIPNESYYNKIMYTFEKLHLPGLLYRVDTTTMAASVEARVPFVDHRLVEFAFSIPVKYKLKWASEKAKKESKLLMSDKISENYDTPKYILKKAFEKEIPKEVLYRKKMGFPVPLNNWFGGNFNNFAKEILLSNQAKKRNIYNTEQIEKWLNDPKLKDNHSFAMKIWMLINLEKFLRSYFDNKPKI